MLKLPSDTKSIVRNAQGFMGAIYSMSSVFVGRRRSCKPGVFELKGDAADGERLLAGLSIVGEPIMHGEHGIILPVKKAGDEKKVRRIHCRGRGLHSSASLMNNRC